MYVSPAAYAIWLYAAVLADHRAGLPLAPLLSPQPTRQTHGLTRCARVRHASPMRPAPHAHTAGRRSSLDDLAYPSPASPCDRGHSAALPGAPAISHR